jgi:hypothetical protein
MQVSLLCIHVALLTFSAKKSTFVSGNDRNFCTSSLMPHYNLWTAKQEQVASSTSTERVTVRRKEGTVTETAQEPRELTGLVNVFRSIKVQE